MDGYQGLTETTIASMPLEDLYKRIDRHMNKTNSFFDLRLSQAIKQNELREKTQPMSISAAHNEQETQLLHGAPIITFEKLRARFLHHHHTKSAGRVRPAASNKVQDFRRPGGGVLQQISNDFDLYT